MKMLRFFTIVFPLIFTFALAVGTTAPESAIAQEIRLLKDQDPAVKMFYAMKDEYLKDILNSIDCFAHIDTRASTIDKSLEYFFLNVYPGGLLKLTFPKGLVMLSEQKAPKLHAMVKGLADKLAIPKPLIFLSGDPEFYNAMASSFGVNHSMIIIGEKLLNAMTDPELAAVLAHELGHVKHNHVPKMLGLAIGGAATIYMLKALFEKLYPKSEVPDVNSPSYQAELGTLAITCGGLIALGALLRYVSCRNEEEADNEAIKIDPQGFTDAMKAMEKEYTQKYEKYLAEFNFVKSKLAELAKTCPRAARYLEYFADMYHGECVAQFQGALTEETGDHPPFKARIALGEEAIKQAA